MTLDKLETAIKNACPRRRKVNFIRYADDFIVTADSRELIEEKILPIIKDFLKPSGRSAAGGLELSEEKTRIVKIDEGFDFLGQHLQKYRNKLIITPTKENMKSFLEKVRNIIRKCYGVKTCDMIKQLNAIIISLPLYPVPQKTKRRQSDR